MIKIDQVNGPWDLTLVDHSRVEVCHGLGNAKAAAWVQTRESQTLSSWEYSRNILVLEIGNSIPRMGCLIVAQWLPSHAINIMYAITDNVWLLSSSTNVV